MNERVGSLGCVTTMTDCRWWWSDFNGRCAWCRTALGWQWRGRMMVEILVNANSALSIECNGRNGGGCLWIPKIWWTTHCSSLVRHYTFSHRWPTGRVRTSRRVRENMTPLQQAATSPRCYNVSWAFVLPPLARICATAGVATAVRPRISVDRVYAQCSVLAKATVRVSRLSDQPVEWSRQMCSV